MLVDIVRDGSTSLNARVCGSVVVSATVLCPVFWLLAGVAELSLWSKLALALFAVDRGDPVSMGTALVRLELGAAGSVVGVVIVVVTAAMLTTCVNGMGGSNQILRYR